MASERAAVFVSPPRGTGVTDVVGANRQQATTSTSATAVPVFLSTAPASAGAYFTFTPSKNCRIRFGTSAVGAAVSTDRCLYAGISYDFWCDYQLDSHFSVIRDTEDGVLEWNQSSR